jgi:hypothetical protein
LRAQTDIESLLGHPPGDARKRANIRDELLA